MIDNLSGSKFKTVLYRLAFKRLLCSVNNEELINLYHSVYNISKEQFFIQPDTIDDFGMRILREDKDNTDEGYIFTGGNSYRDWELFLKVVKALPQYQFIGVAAKQSFPKGNLPPNLTMYFDIPGEKFLSLLRHCRIGYIPNNEKWYIHKYVVALRHVEYYMNFNGVGGARRILFSCCGGTGTNIWDLS